MVPAGVDSPTNPKSKVLLPVVKAYKPFTNRTLERQTAQKHRETSVQITCELSTGILPGQQQATLIIKWPRKLPNATDTSAPPLLNIHELM